MLHNPCDPGPLVTSVHIIVIQYNYNLVYFGDLVSALIRCNCTFAQAVGYCNDSDFLKYNCFLESRVLENRLDQLDVISHICIHCVG